MQHLLTVTLRKYTSHNFHNFIPVKSMPARGYYHCNTRGVCKSFCLMWSLRVQVQLLLAPLLGSLQQTADGCGFPPTSVWFPTAILHQTDQYIKIFHVFFFVCLLQCLASTSGDGTIKIWALSDFSCVKVQLISAYC